MNRIYGIGDEEELANDLQEEMKRMIPIEVLDKIRAEIADGKIDFDLDIGQEIHYNRAIDDVLILSTSTGRSRNEAVQI